jgi:hypothetical protein
MELLFPQGKKCTFHGRYLSISQILEQYRSKSIIL